MLILEMKRKPDGYSSTCTHSASSARKHITGSQGKPQACANCARVDYALVENTLRDRVDFIHSRK